MKFPHTHFTKGKTVRIKLRGGEVVIGRFVQRCARFVVLENAKIETRFIIGMNEHKKAR